MIGFSIPRCWKHTDYLAICKHKPVNLFQQIWICLYGVDNDTSQTQLNDTCYTTTRQIVSYLNAILEYHINLYFSLIFDTSIDRNLYVGKYIKY